MISTGSRSLEVPMDVDRFADSLRGSKWREIRQSLGDTYEVRTLYEGPLPGLPRAQVVRLSSGDPDSPIRILFDAVPLSLSRPVLVAGRAVTRVFTSRARERAELLDRIAVRIHVIEVDGDATDIPPLPLATGLDGGLRLAHSVANEQAWSALRESVQRFRPTLAMDLRDAGAAVPDAHLALMVHSLTHAAGEFELEPLPGTTEGRAIARDIARRGISPYRSTPSERASAGLRQLGNGALTRMSPRDPSRSVAGVATDIGAAVGITALALGLRELDRAIALTEAAAAGVDESIREFRRMGA